MKYISGVFFLFLASVATAALVTRYRPVSEPSPASSVPLPEIQAPQVAEVVVVHRVVHEYLPASTTTPTVQHLDGSTSRSPRYEEKFPGVFVRQH